MKTRIFTSMLVIALAAALVGGATMALFTSTATNANNSFAAGTVVVAIYRPSTTLPVTPLNITNMAPGDTVTGSFDVMNTGTLQLRFDVTEQETGPLFTLAGGATITMPGSQNIVLSPGARHTVGFSVYLPITAGNNFQGATGTVDFLVEAEQTANNP